MLQTKGHGPTNSFSLGLYLALALIALVPVLFHSIDKDWVGDFWLHAAVVREFISHPYNPRHPFLNLESGDPLSSPYLYGLSLIARLLNLTATQVLSGVAVPNYLFFVLSFYVFTTKFFVRREYAPLGLFLVLFLWGSNAWSFSGFYHFNVIHLITPYPSFFCQTITFLTLAYFSDLDVKLKPWKYILLVSVYSFVLLSHQLTFIFLVVGHFSLACTSSIPRKAILNLGLIKLASLSLALLWPFYSLFSLFLNVPDKFHADAASMYQDVLLRIWPVLILLLLAVLFKARSTLNRLVYAPFLLLFIYLYGWWFEKYIYGREIGNIILLGQLFIASFIAQSFPKLRQIYSLIPSLAVLAMVIYGATAFGNYIQRTPLNSVYWKYLELENKIPAEAVVLTTLSIARVLPAFSGKVIASPHPTSSISDHAQRVADIEVFFRSNTDVSFRQKIIRRYNIDFILLTKLNLTPDLLIGLTSVGQKTYENDSHLLFKVF